MKQFLTLMIISVITTNICPSQTNLFVGEYEETSSWNITSWDLISNENIISTEGGAAMTLAFSEFSEPLGAGETLDVSFDSNEVTNFATTGWAGISFFFIGGTNGTEQIFIGSLSSQPNWGLDGSSFLQVPFAETSELVSVRFTYEYDTGSWSLEIGDEFETGTITSNLALNTIRIGATIDNITDIAISNLTVQKNTETLSSTDFNLENNISFYPNPSHDVIKISGIEKPLQYSIYSALGVKILSGVISDEDYINIESLAQGIYHLRLDKSIAIKIVKK